MVCYDGGEGVVGGVSMRKVSECASQGYLATGVSGVGGGLVRGKSGIVLGGPGPALSGRYNGVYSTNSRKGIKGK